ncbi:hypothetical protein KC361_g3226 [Hortaea werneckii]|nr:hypothetical protein KC361_g3226 [Hortaea werneckii]
MAMRPRVLVRLAYSAEDVATRLRNFRNGLTGQDARITASISKLFAISSLLQQLDEAQNDRDQGPSFYRIRDDVSIIIPSLERTLQDSLEMVARSQNRPSEVAWDDMQFQMSQEEGLGLHERLALYHDFLRAQSSILAAPSTPRVPGIRAPARPVRSPSSPSEYSDQWDYSVRPPPLAPEVPISPTFTSISSQSLDSSQTSYSSDPYYYLPTVAIHWSSEIFDGRHPETSFRDSYYLRERSTCFGNPDPDALRNLTEDGFVRAFQLPFEGNQLRVRLYWRPVDSRARILIMTKGRFGEDLCFCMPIVNLKVIRNLSSLQLCRARRDGTYDMWARLNFETYERMVVFYNTFVAMKHQDSREIPHENLLDHLELRCDGGEYEIFGGAIKHGELRHALRLFKDRSSGVVRLEASALRGPMRDVPLWTAFVTRYVGDPDWALYEPGGLVSLAAVRPRLYVFLSGYGPPHRGRDEYLLDFVTSEGKKLLFASSLYPSQQLTPSKMQGNSLNHGPDFVDSRRHTDEDLVVSASVIPFSAALARIPRSLVEMLYASLQICL